jgi:hypothetical protein
VTVANPPPPVNPQQWLQLLTPATLQFAYGTGTFVWPGATNQSNQSLINHGLPRTPIAFGGIATGLGPGPIGFFVWSPGAPSSTQIILQGASLNGASVTAGTGGTFQWWAIG